MASPMVGTGMLQFRSMLSLDAIGVTGRGYPVLLQCGGSYHGVPIHDRQHPHDFFMELRALYLQPITRTIGVELYAAPSGEPALGPVAFMHRPSAMDDPVAPIGHHWQDATHISFGVVTAGLFTRQWKIEGSIFKRINTLASPVWRIASCLKVRWYSIGPTRSLVERSSCSKARATSC